MNRRQLFGLVIALAAPRLASAEGLIYRDGATGLSKAIVSSGDTKAAGLCVGSTFAGFPISAKATIDSVGAGPCGTAKTLASFSAKFKVPALPSANTGIFLYDAATGAIIDVVGEGDPTPLGAGTTWGDFGGNNPAVVIEEAPACIAHVFFRAKVEGAPAASDTGIFAARFSLPGLALVWTGAYFVEGGGGTALPFPAGSVWGDFPASTKIDAVSGAGSGTFKLGFRAQVTGAGVTNSNDTGLFLYRDESEALYTAAREGDPTCVPTWPGGGAVFDDFPASLPVVVADAGVPFAMFRAKSRGGPMASDTAIVVAYPAPTCGTVGAASENDLAPVGGLYADFPASTKVATTGGYGVFTARVTGGPGATKVLVLNLTTAVARQGMPDSALGALPISLPADPGLTVNDAGTVMFNMTVSGYPTGLFAYNSGLGVVPAQAVTFGCRNAQIDDLGNSTARCP
ncbi:MAG: hypothetical protein HY699_08295 [Deltaproteobacteria bacterium]|nr:hypothetical protein [Deltaproteobacteria bacterium]